MELTLQKRKNYKGNGGASYGIVGIRAGVYIGPKMFAGAPPDELTIAGENLATPQDKTAERAAAKADREAKKTQRESDRQAKREKREAEKLAKEQKRAAEKAEKKAARAAAKSQPAAKESPEL